MATTHLGFGRLVRADLRHNPGSFVGVAVSVLVATALITGLGVLVESGMRGGLAPERYTNADVIVGGSQAVDVPEDLPVPLVERASLPDDAADAIAALPGVEAVVADVTVTLASDAGPIEAHPWSASALSGFEISSGNAPSGRDEVVVTASSTAALGDVLTLSHGGDRAEYRVVGIADAATEPVRIGHVFLSEARIAQLDSGNGDAQILGVFAADGTTPQALADAITERFPEVTAQTGAGRGDVEFLDSGAARASLVSIGSAFAGTCLLVAMFIVSGTLSLSVQSRRRDFALLRAVGASSAQVHRLVAREVLTVSAIAAAIGIVPGYFLATVLQGAFVQAGVIPGDFALAASPIPAAVAALLVLGAAWGAARIAASRPAKIDPIEALRESATGPTSLSLGRLITGIVFAAAGLSISTVPLVVRGQSAAGAAAGASIILIIALALLGPVLVSFTVRFIGAVLRKTSAAGFLASANGTVNARRLASAITPIALGISLGLVQLGAPAMIASEANAQTQAGVISQLRVSAPGGLSDEGIQLIEEQSGVVAVNPVTVSQAVLDHHELGKEEITRTALVLQGIDTDAAESTMDLQVKEGSLDALAGAGEVALSTDARQTLGLDVGDTLVGRFGDGVPFESEVVAIYGRGLGFGDITMSGEVVRQHTTSALSGFALVNAGDDVENVRTALTDAGFVVGGGSGAQAAGADVRSQQGWVNAVALIVILGYIAIAVVNTLMMATGERSREFALLQLIGASRRQVRGMMRTEAVMLALIAMVFGVAIAIPPLIGMSMGISGRPIPTLPLLQSLIVIGSMCALALAALAVATRSAMRGRPVEEIGSRQ
ncbi:ABC transporter permease [Microbacterium sp. LTA6]|uniref:FtsX-like permease family protein n=1 Tax=Microbacterium sp. LTA6 TaxID=3129771 RepID=UPI00324536C0